MRTFSYLFRRLLHPGLLWFSAAALILFLLPGLLISDLFADPTSYQVRDPKTRLSDFVFQSGSEPHELQLPYLREDYIEDLGRYLIYLRQEKTALTPGDPAHRQWISHLSEQEVLHLDRLNRTHGLNDQEKYYYSRYAPHWTKDLFSDEVSGEEKGIWDLELIDASQWDPIIERALGSDDPLTVARGRNLELQLPLVSNGSTASARLLLLIQASRFLLVLIPLCAFYVLFAAGDRNLRRRRLPGGGNRPLAYRTAAVFAFSGLFVILSRLIWYGALRLWYGDLEGAMFIVPAWAGVSSVPSAAVQTLREYLVIITLTDLAFGFFLTALIVLIWRLTQSAGASAAIIAVGTMLPLGLQGTGEPVGPLHLFRSWSYLNWSLDPGTLTGTFPTLPFTHSFLSPPPSAAFNFIFWGILTLMALWLLDYVLAGLTRHQADKTGPKQ